MYVFNHRSYFDILVGYTTGPMPMAFVSKDDLAHVPLITRWMKAMKCLFLDRNDLKKGLQTILEGIELLKSGHSVFIAPEGTRNHGDELLEFHQASFKLAEKSHRPIIPVALNNTDEAFENHSRGFTAHTLLLSIANRSIWMIWRRLRRSMLQRRFVKLSAKRSRKMRQSCRWVFSTGRKCGILKNSLKKGLVEEL